MKSEDHSNLPSQSHSKWHTRSSMIFDLKEFSPERWGFVMGEDYKVDIRTTEKIASRIPFPADAANELAFQLNVD